MVVHSAPASRVGGAGGGTDSFLFDAAAKGLVASRFRGMEPGSVTAEPVFAACNELALPSCGMLAASESGAGESG